MKPVTRVQRSYTRLRKIQVLMWLKYYQLPNARQNTAIKMRPSTLNEASVFFQIPKTTIAEWARNPQKILEQAGSSHCDTPIVFLCMWPEMEKKLFDAFVKCRELGRPVRDGWFQRNATELWKQTYPELQVAGSNSDSGLFIFFQGWFYGFLSRHSIVLRFVMNTAQSLPSDYKEQILIRLRFNQCNRILTPLFISQPSPHFLHLLCNVDETSLPREYLIGHTYNLQGVKTVWSKSADSGTEKHQCALLLCIFANGVPPVPPILIFTTPTGDKIRSKESHLWDSRVHVEFSPTGWMNEILFQSLLKSFLFQSLEIIVCYSSLIVTGLTSCHL